MHELAVTQSLLDLVLEEAKKAGASRVQKINVVVGDMSGIVCDCVKFYFEFLGRNTAAEGATIACHRVPIQAICQECGRTFQPSEYDWSCPSCHNTAVNIAAGRELYVESIEVD